MRFTRTRTGTLVAAVVTCLTLTLTAFTPSPGVGRSSRNLPHDEKKLSKAMTEARASGPHCVGGQGKDGKKIKLCLEVVDPSQLPPSFSRPLRAAADPVPPDLCYDKPGQVNYDRFHACQQSASKITFTKEGNPAPQVGWLWWGVWETLPAKGGRSWKMQFGVKPYNLPPDLVNAGLLGTVGTLCTQHCDVSDTEMKPLSNGTYTYYDSQDVKSSGSDIAYSNPAIVLKLSTDDATILWDKDTAELNDPFDIRCDSESYIGSTGGCVHYMGQSAIPIYYISYTGPYAGVAANDLYGETVGDPVNHYGNIQYGHPLTREDPGVADDHRDSICTSSIKNKASALGLSCDEYPYASSEQGGSGNPRFSCAFVPGPENTNQGSDLNSHFYIPNRILPALHETTYIPGDAFWVWVTDAPASPPAVKQCKTY
ncbi:NucA/NucB deoxyribonuclease domain-containing protein [Actinoallomurus sp. NPDC052308]|uniref:NucA/NucB deoxyribonuclease domain-containing protein n=1 Tax=Actinoallomurus sp. NPDC052308 TaxID=3155530 RepID=UPI00341F2238